MSSGIVRTSFIEAYRSSVMDERLSEVRRRIQLLLNERSWSMAELGRRMVPPEGRGWVSARLKDADTELKLADAYRMADALEVEVSTLLSDEDGSPQVVPSVFVQAYERSKASGEVREEPLSPWAGGFAQEVIGRERELFGDNTMAAVNRLDPTHRRMALRLIGLLDDILALGEQAGQ